MSRMTATSSQRGGWFRRSVAREQTLQESDDDDDARETAPANSASGNASDSGSDSSGEVLTDTLDGQVSEQASELTLESETESDSAELQCTQPISGPQPANSSKEQRPSVQSESDSDSSSSSSEQPASKPAPHRKARQPRAFKKAAEKAVADLVFLGHHCLRWTMKRGWQVGDSIALGKIEPTEHTQISSPVSATYAPTFKFCTARICSAKETESEHHGFAFITPAARTCLHSAADSCCIKVSAEESAEEPKPLERRETTRPRLNQLLERVVLTVPGPISRGNCLL